METGSYMDTIFAFVVALNGLQAYIAILAVLFACGLGLPIPEDIILFAAGFLAFEERISLVGALIVGIIGVLIGDTFLYVIGRRYGRAVFTWPMFRRIFTPHRIKLAEDKIQNNGKIICFTARFAPGLRSPIFLTSGILRVPFAIFIGMDGFAALISVPVWIYLAYFLGHQIERVFEIARTANVGIIIGIIVLVTVYIGIKFYLRKRAHINKQESYSIKSQNDSNK